MKCSVSTPSSLSVVNTGARRCAQRARLPHGRRGAPQTSRTHPFSPKSCTAHRAAAVRLAPEATRPGGTGVFRPTRVRSLRGRVVLSVDVDSSETLDLTEENVELVLDQVCRDRRWTGGHPPYTEREIQLVDFLCAS
eukprot:scaffold4102_cov404-Prasinococcus_capsulatus_cf.AAC.2